MAKLSRQVTPPAWRIWIFGIGATALAALTNYSWLYLCQEIFNWNLLIPKFTATSELVTATAIQVVIATVVALAEGEDTQVVWRAVHETLGLAPKFR